ncbi:MAG TPA: hypothetical protein VN769_05080 [Xanthobacteraceae bacterium]|nr:hypothetical protein [Xanthobacteraceae bacterium]
MATSRYLAKLIGPIFLTIGIGMLVNGPFYRDLITEAVASHVLIYLSGVLSLLAGLAVVMAHNRWSGGWPIIITVLGWLMVIGGVIRIVVPQLVQTVAGTIYAGHAAIIVAAILCVALGGFLSFKGFSQ